MCDIRNSKSGYKVFGGTLLSPDQQRIRNELVASLVREGMTLRQAAARAGVSKTHAGRIANLYGVTRKIGRPRLKPEDEALLDGGSHG